MAPSAVRASVGLDEIRGVLEERAVGATAEVVHAAAVAAMLSTVDAGGRMLTPEEVARWTGDPEEAVDGGAPAGASPVARRSVLAAFELWPDGIAYLRVGRLGEGEGDELLGHLRALVGEGVESIILDLRHASGNDLQSVVTLASPFRCPDEPLFSVRDNRGREIEARVASAAPPLRVVLILLVGADTRGAGELLAAVLDGCGDVMVIGRRTAGDARVRELLRLADGSGLYVGTRQVVPGRGRPYGGTGVQPNVVVLPSSTPGDGASLPLAGPGQRPPSEQSRRDHELMQRVAHDPTLRRATDILRGLKALGMHAGR
jgi:hypothetical protein